MKHTKFRGSVKYAIEGIKSCIQREKNMRIHLIMMGIVIVCGWLFQLDYGEWMICILLFGFVISLEMINTAIEAVVDLCSPDIHPLAKLAKDVSAGAVLVSALTASVIGLMIFLPKI